MVDSTKTFFFRLDFDFVAYVHKERSPSSFPQCRVLSNPSRALATFNSSAKPIREVIIVPTHVMFFSKSHFAVEIDVYS